MDIHTDQPLDYLPSSIPSLPAHLKPPAVVCKYHTLADYYQALAYFHRQGFKGDTSLNDAEVSHDPSATMSYTCVVKGTRYIFECYEKTEL